MFRSMREFQRKRMASNFLILIQIFLTNLIGLSSGQYYASNFLSALRGYGTDLCRFVSCPFGQICINGVCQANAGMGYGLSSALSGYGLGGLGYGSSLYGGGGYGYGGGTYGAYAAANKLCADTVDCYSGQICQAGRCVFQSGYGGLGALSGYGLTGGYNGIGYGGLGVGGLGYGTDPALAASGLYSPYGLGSLTYRQSGLQMCTLMQDCPNGQICVNGFCSESNVAYGGSQLFKTPTSCSTGAICPVGHLCMGGFCAKDFVSQTSTCGLGFICPFGMSCHFGRCAPSNSLLYGKKKRKK